MKKGQFQERHGNSKKNQKEFLELKNTKLEIKNSLSIKRKFGNIGKWICECDDRLIEITQTE